jgi:hypothetical protein
MEMVVEKEYVITENLMKQFSKIAYLIQNDVEFKEMVSTNPKAAFEARNIEIPNELIPDEINGIDMIEYLDIYCGWEVTDFKLKV